MVVKGSHFEDAFFSALIMQNLYDNAQPRYNETHARKSGIESVARKASDTGNRRARRERTAIPHENLCGANVEKKERDERKRKDKSI